MEIAVGREGLVCQVVCAGKHPAGGTFPKASAHLYCILFVSILDD